MPVVFLAIRNLFLTRKRHALITLSILIISSLITLITGALYGSLEAIKIKAGRYFAGTASITGYLNQVPIIPRPERLINKLERSSLPIRTISARTVYYNGDAVLFFNGETVRQRKLIGIDFSTESAEFRTLALREGSWQSLTSEGGKNGILISVPASNLLGCRVGDEIALSLTTDTGQYTTARLIIQGIFDETSLFGFVAYMRRIDLNQLLTRNPGSATDIAVYAKKGIDGERFTEKVRNILAEHFDVLPRFQSREERLTAIYSSELGTEKISILSQNAQLVEIKQLMDALQTVTNITMAFFVAIIMVGILNTYRVLVFERIKEIGTLRTIGMSRIQVRALFLIEAAIMACTASILGLILGILLFRIISLFDFTFVPAAGLFLEQGRMRFELNLKTVLLNLGLMVSSALFAVWGPAQKAARIDPAEALRSV